MAVQSLPREPPHSPRAPHGHSYQVTVAGPPPRAVQLTHLPLPPVTQPPRLNKAVVPGLGQQEQHYRNRRERKDKRPPGPPRPRALLSLSAPTVKLSLTQAQPQPPVLFPDPEHGRILPLSKRTPRPTRCLLSTLRALPEEPAAGRQAAAEPHACQQHQKVQEQSR